MKRICLSATLLFLFYLKIFAQLNNPTEFYLKEFLGQPPTKKFVIKSDFSYSDTLSLSKLPKSNLVRTFTNQAIKIPPEQNLTPPQNTTYKPEINIDNKVKLVVYFKTNYFNVDVNLEANRLYSISLSIKTGDYTDNLSLSFNESNQPYIYNLQKTKTTRVGNTTKYDITEGKHIDFTDKSVYNQTLYAEETQLCAQLAEFGTGLIFYIKNKNCVYKDYLAGRKIFTPKHLIFVNKAVDSLIRMYAMQEQVNENLANLEQLKNAELVIQFIYTNHYKDGHIYQASDPMIVNIPNTKGNMTYYRLCTTIKEVLDKVVKKIPTPTKYCMPIKYNKTVYVFYSKGKVIQISE